MSSERSAVVTGAARGIGRAVAERLVGLRYAVIVTDIDRAAARTTAEQIGAAAGLGQDVRDEASHAAVAEEAARHGVLRVWVNNAGVGYDGGLAELPSREARDLVEVNLLGTLWGMRAALRAFGPLGGDIVNVASLSGLGPVPGLSVYAATKAAVVSLTASVAVEAPKRVGVHCVCPDGVATDLVADMKDDGLAKALVHSGGRLLSVDEVGDAVVAMIGSRRVIRTVPAWRGALLRSAGLAPRLYGPALPAVERLGRLVMRRRGA